MICPSCQSEMAAGSTFCSSCGAVVSTGGGAAAAPALQSRPGGLSDNAAGAIAYLTIIPAIIFLVMEPYNRNRFVRFHAFQCIALTVVSIAAHLIVNILPVLGLMISLLLSLIFFAVWVMCVIKASKGEKFVLPVISEFAEKQANA